MASMHLYSLRLRILLVAALPVMVMTGALGWQLIQYRVVEQGQRHFDQLNQLTYSISKLLSAQKKQSSSQNYTAYSQALLSARQIKSVTFLDASLQVLNHQGESISARLNPDTFPLNTPKLFNLHGRSMFMVPLFASEALAPDMLPTGTTSKPTGWILIEADNKQLDSSMGEMIKQAIWSLLIILGACLLAIRYLCNKIIRPITDATKALSQITEESTETRIDESPVQEINALGIGINTLAERLTQIQSDMKQEIVQTTEDLRETLETIETQNVELDIARKQAILANRTKSQFLANMSHEIRTPLNGILGFTKLLLKSPLNSRQLDHLQTIKKSSEILLLIINDILDFSKIEAGKLLLEKSPIIFHELIDDVVTMLAPTAHAKNLELVHLHYQDVPREIMGDSLRIKQIVTNLINNAIKFTHSGQVVVRVMLEDEDTSMTQEFIRISVSDTGVGLSRAQQHSIFSAFSQADATTARNYGGSGLGLSISKKLIEQMDGNISFESELGSGSTFWFTLPIEIPSTTKTAEQPHLLKNYSILCCEPSHAPRLAIEHLLQAWQTHYQFSDSIEQLIHLAEKTRLQAELCNVTLLCLNRNEVDQAENTATVKQLIKLGQKVILVTPTLEEYELEIIHLATAHLVKPLTRTPFYHALCELCSNSKETPRQHKPTNLPDVHDDQLSSLPVLAVDDNDINLSLVASILESLGANADIANNGFEALELCRHKAYGLILMDIQMPGMDGIEAMKKIRLLNTRFEHTPIIALTAYALPEEREAFLRQGFQNLITKPVDEEKLARVISSYMQETAVDEVGLTTSHDAPSTSQPAHLAAEAVDREEGIRLCNGNPDLANTLLTKFLANLTDEKANMTQLYSEGRLPELETAIHKLHGACHYCGVPALRDAIRVAEHMLKVSEKGLEQQIWTVLSEIDRIIEWQKANLAPSP